MLVRLYRISTRGSIRPVKYPREHLLQYTQHTYNTQQKHTYTTSIVRQSITHMHTVQLGVRSFVMCVYAVLRKCFSHVSFCSLRHTQSHQQRHRRSGLLDARFDDWRRSHAWCYEHTCAGWWWEPLRDFREPMHMVNS